MSSQPKNGSIIIRKIPFISALCSNFLSDLRVAEGNNNNFVDDPNVLFLLDPIYFVE